MIDRQHGCIVISCDGCDETYEGDKDTEFEILWNTAKSEGWSAKKIGKEWIHACRKCGAPR